jgi:pyridoxamine 5'-phosphate oxidase
MSLRDLRREYASRTLNETDADPDPIVQFRQWFDQALGAELTDANAMTLATVGPDGDPSVRTVLLKGFDKDGFVFYTNHVSAKGRDLASRPRAALLFFWAELERQVRITGAVTPVSREESEAYFHSRPRESQLGAWASPQSQVIPSRDVLEAEYRRIGAEYPDPAVPVPLPPHWGGYRVAPERIEFWQGRANRLHDRLLYTRGADGQWTRVRLAP